MLGQGLGLDKGFLILPLLTFEARHLLIVRGFPGHHRMLSNNPGLYLLDHSSTPLTSSDNQKCLRTLPDVLGGQENKTGPGWESLNSTIAKI